jgi:hypothetical protein
MMMRCMICMIWWASWRHDSSASPCEEKRIWLVLTKSVRARAPCFCGNDAWAKIGHGPRVSLTVPNRSPNRAQIFDLRSSSDNDDDSNYPYQEIGTMHQWIYHFEVDEEIYFVIYLYSYVQYGKIGARDFGWNKFSLIMGRLSVNCISLNTGKNFNNQI